MAEGDRRRRLPYLDFEYVNPRDKDLLDVSLHAELNRLETMVKALAETLYHWELLDDGRAPEVTMTVELHGLMGKYPQRGELRARFYRSFRLEVSVTNSDSFEFDIYEHAEETVDEPWPMKWREVAWSEVKRDALGVPKS